MTVIGITGPSGAGKGEASKILQSKYGFCIIDADVVYHSLVSAPSACLDEIRLHFGNGVIDSRGALNREALGKIVFGEANRDKLLLLNSITHKYVVKRIKGMLKYRMEKNINCVIDAPLLIEAGLCRYCDFTISVLADEYIRAERITTRDGISLCKAKCRISSQKGDDFYISGTDYSVKNNGDISLLESSIMAILSERSVMM